MFLLEAYLPALGLKPLSAVAQGAHEMLLASRSSHLLRLLHREAMCRLTDTYQFMARTRHFSSVHSSTRDYK